MFVNGTGKLEKRIPYNTKGCKVVFHLNPNPITFPIRLIAA